MELGWEIPKEKGRFDLLPIVVHAPNEPPKYFDVSDILLEVHITHPKLELNSGVVGLLAYMFYIVKLSMV